MSAMRRKTLRSSAAGRSDAGRRAREGGTQGRYCRQKPWVKLRLARASFLDHDVPMARGGAFLEHVVAFRLRGARQVARAARVVERELDHVADGERDERHLALRPAERAGHPAEIELRTRGHPRELPEMRRGATSTP